MGKDYYNNRLIYENQKNGARAYNSYQPAPTAPTLEVTINQNNPVGASTSYGPRRPPSAPPPPPPVNNDYAQPIYCSAPYNPVWIDRFYRRENKGMFRLVLVEFLLAAVMLAGGVWCLRDTSDYCPYSSGIWTSSIFLLNALVGGAAAKLGNHNLYMGHLVLSLISIMLCAIGGILSARNWVLVGTYHHPRIERDEAFCLLGQHDAPRISHIFSHMDRYDFAQCLFQLKVGVAVNSVQFVIAVIEALLNILSAVLCCKRTCHRV